MEVFAAFMAHTDAQVGRVLDAVDQLGAGENTLVLYVTGDNGASAEGTIHGAWSAPSFQNGVPEDPAWLLEHMDDFGSARCENHFNVGWAWALDAPFQWMKQVASHFGGTRNGLAVSWPARISDAGGLRSQFHHVVDIAPTILEAAGVPWPETVDGIEQMPVHGTPMGYSFDDNTAASRRTTQYFEILGNRAVYHDGWIASCFHGRVPWIRLAAYEFDGPDEHWELYNIANDFSQSVDLSAQFPDKLAELVDLCRRERVDRVVFAYSDVSHAEVMHQASRALGAGADFVLSYASLGVQSVFSQVTGRELVVLGEGVDLFYLKLPPALAGKTLADTEIGAKTGLNVIAVQEEGEILTDLSPDRELQKGSTLLAIGSQEQRERFGSVYR